VEFEEVVSPELAQVAVILKIMFLQTLQNE